MATKKKKADETIEIIFAEIKDDFCNYHYSIKAGMSNGFVHKVTGKGIIDEDMRKAFSALNVHLCAYDDAFKLSGIEITDINAMEFDDLATNYYVSSFKLQGGEESNSIILVGNKFVSSGSRMGLTTPKIILDNLSSYKWTEQLQAAADACCQEVLAYHSGKYTVPVVEEEEPEEPKGNASKTEE